MRRYLLCDARLQWRVKGVEVITQMPKRSVPPSAQHAHNFNAASLHTRDIDPHLGQGRIVRRKIIDSDGLGVVVIFVAVEMEGSNDEMGHS